MVLLDGQTVFSEMTMQFLLKFWREKCSLSQLQSMENFKQAVDVWQKVYLGCENTWGCIVLDIKSKTQGKEITLGQPKMIDILLDILSETKKCCLDRRTHLGLSTTDINYISRWITSEKFQSSYKTTEIEKTHFAYSKITNASGSFK